MLSERNRSLTVAARRSTRRLQTTVNPGPPWQGFCRAAPRSRPGGTAWRFRDAHSFVSPAAHLSAPRLGALTGLGIDLEPRVARAQQLRIGKAGAPSADADDALRVKPNHEVMAGDRGSRFDFDADEHWCPICSSEHVRNG